MKSVVTGGGGFLGRYVIRALLERGDEVVSLSRGQYSDLANWGVAQVRCDLRDAAAVATALAGADQVFHTAARVGVWGPRREFYETNVTGTENILSACRAAKVARLIFTSSPSVVFDGTSHRGVDESYPYPAKWLSPYAETKKLAEERVLRANGQGGVYTVALRPHLIWGKEDKYLIPRVLEQGKRGKLIRVGNGKNRVDIVHVRNAARAHLLAAEKLGPGSACAGKAYFISQGEPVVLWDFIDEVLRRGGAGRVKKEISFSAAYRLGASLEMGYRMLAPHREPRMTRFLAHQLALDHFYDISAARRDLGYHPTVTTEEGLRELFA